MKTVKILFVGNSHTYNCDIPYRVKLLAAADKIDCQVAMNAHGGWTLYQHSKEPDVPFNLRYGGYDFAVFQEHAHPFDYGGHMMEALPSSAEAASYAALMPSCKCRSCFWLQVVYRMGYAPPSLAQAMSLGSASIMCPP